MYALFQCVWEASYKKKVGFFRDCVRLVDEKLKIQCRIFFRHFAQFSVDYFLFADSCVECKKIFFQHFSQFSFDYFLFTDSSVECKKNIFSILGIGYRFFCSPTAVQSVNKYFFNTLHGFRSTSFCSQTAVQTEEIYNSF